MQFFSISGNPTIGYLILKNSFRDFPGGPMVKTLCFHYRGHGFDPWSRELRSHMPCGTAKKKKIILVTYDKANLH